MASAPHHTRSNSLPSRPNLLVSPFDEQLSRLRSSESASSSSSSSISSKLSHLSDLYDCIDEFLQLPSSIKALTSQVKFAEDALEGSIKLLDIMLESVLVSIAGPKAESAVSKLFKSKRITTQQETEFFLFGFETTEAALHPEKVRSCLESMEINIKDVEQGIEILFRHLIKTRTTILNILN